MTDNMQIDKSSSTFVRDELSSFMTGLPDRSEGYEGAVAVGVSGGPDSMALVHALSVYFSKHDKDVCIHALTVDHGLRAEAAEEAQMVKDAVSSLDNVKHEILVWDHSAAPDARVQERARHARYDLFAQYMDQNNITHLFLAHHMDDQAETFLFRLAKGSGLDGLACMSDIQERFGWMFLCRPFLGVCKDDIVAYCDKERVPHVHDPSNDAEVYARVRLRKSMDVLQDEGLTAKRLYTTAKRLARARDALDDMAGTAYVSCLSSNDTNRLVFNFNPLKINHKEVVLRVLIRGFIALCGQQDYGVRLERLENLCDDLLKPSDFRKRTLGGVIFEVCEKSGTFIMTLEHS